MAYTIQRVISSRVLDENMDKLKRKFQHLECKKDDIKEELKRAEISSMKKPRKEVINWLTNVENVKNQIRQLEQEVSSGSGLFKRLQLEGKVVNFTEEVTELDNQSKFPRGITLDAYQNVALLTRALVGKRFQKNKKMIRDYLIDGKDSIIGVYGMGGVGKTTLLKHIHNQLLLEHRISVSWVTVSQNFSIRKLQHDIARTVNLDISEVDDEIKKAVLAQALKSNKEFILILDDVWESICLDEVGIPVGENGCKLVLTTRSETVCRMMQCRNPIKVEPLSYEEAWILFKETLGNDQTLLSREIEEIAKSLVRECDGLPLGIIVLAGSMRGVDDIHEWRNALEEIRAAERWNDDMEFYEVFRVLKFSYDKLKDTKMQECLLYCSLFPEDELIPRDELIEYFIVEELIDGRNNRQSKLDKGHAILNKLEKVCLLEGQINNKKKKCVKMHDLVRDMAIKIASGSSQFLVEAGMRLRDIPTEEKWSENLVRVSLMSNDISNIPSNKSPRCPRLLTLLLARNYFLSLIPDDFFMHMKMLSVLDLSYTGIESLPTSISYVESLTALLLEGCGNLRYVPSLENLTALRQLDLRLTNIRELPKGMEKLVNLRYLDIDGCQRLKGQIILDGILSQLSHIEYFKSDGLKLRVAEIANWRELETFLGIFDHIDDLNTCVKSWEDREDDINYTIFSENKDELSFGECDSSKFLKQIHLSSIETEFILESTCIQYLSLVGCGGITNLTHIAKLSKALRACRIRHCKMMRHVICSCCCNNVLPQLEILNLYNLPMLTDLIERERSMSSSSSLLQVNCFSSLKELVISHCDGLKRFFTPSQLLNLQCLESLNVSFCKQLGKIISDEDEGQEEAITTIISFPPKLWYVNLYNIPELKSICSWSIKVSNALEVVNIVNCPKLTRITLLWEEPNPPASLKTIKVEKSWWNSSLAWKHPQTKAVLQPFVKYFLR